MFPCLLWLLLTNNLHQVDEGESVLEVGTKISHQWRARFSFEVVVDPCCIVLQLFLGVGEGEGGGGKLWLSVWPCCVNCGQYSHSKHSWYPQPWQCSISSLTHTHTHTHYYYYTHICARTHTTHRHTHTHTYAHAHTQHIHTLYTDNAIPITPSDFS